VIDALTGTEQGNPGDHPSKAGPPWRANTLRASTWAASWIVAGVLDCHRDRLLRDLVHYQVSEGLVRLQRRGNSVVVAGSFYGYAALGTDRYPPFTLADVPDYLARLDLEYPQQLNRWLPLVKWLLAFPQYILLSALVGSG
jgi:hypothetical protein